MRAGRKQLKVAKVQAWVQRFREDMQLRSLQMGLCEWKDAQWSRVLQWKGLRRQGQARWSECTRCQGLSRTESATSRIQRIPSPSPPKAAPKLKYSHMVKSTL